ncbi:zinc finger and BTB domain-containing protein 40-like isoform X1 [Penaeus japonicus]|uniref:zinc finger and BTB domain-containing protein 40-like isoform X1 n=1 Tax=Penaeus japonicus TaxID=27405 RepID=UPI001C70BC5B|nr:zinc finger and BTB domain-containing protein 40-like isoform X1 [Penaeus japonicus]XP_042879862.1 zinc finger and BTB domain-containing protein 40-like isoform X1 [Penaeus japonicus]XP_042879863.1 zinc finger and BTB domain-containing protein 40-like isoform X1 [Penaeus japonicus]
MSGHGRRSHKRKVEELQDEDHRSNSTARESAKHPQDRNSREVPETQTVLTLTEENFARLDASKLDEYEEEDTGEVSQEEEHEDGTVSQGTMWRGDTGENLDATQVFLRCRREPNNENFDCETQTVHFRPVREDRGGAVAGGSEGSKRATLASLNLKTVKEEQHSNKESASAIKKCCIEDCESRSDRTESSVTYIPVSDDENSKKLLDLSQHSKKSTQIYMCSLHLLNPTKLTKTKGKTRKKKTCDMLLAEEAEKIKMGLASGRPKRTPKPNKNYDWAELIPLIKSEPQEEEEISLESSPGASVQQSGGLAGRRRKQLLSSVKKEDKENERPGEVEELEETNPCESEPEDYGENVSQPSQLRFPPPKPKGRPPRIRDICTQTDAMRNSNTRQPLREVKVQCNLTAEPLASCPSCSGVDWERLEELLAECLPQIERELCDPQVAACIQQVLSTVQTSTHATNFLQLLCGGERDELESSKGIVLVSCQEDPEEVEIENMIHPEVEAPVSGVREITPKVWRRKPPLVNIKKEEMDDLEDDVDDLGLQAATDLDDEEFTPGLDAQEEDDNDEIDDDEDWNVKNAGESGLIPVRKKQKRMYGKIKKGRDCLGGETEGQEAERESGTDNSEEEEEEEEDDQEGNSERDAYDRMKMHLSKGSIVRLRKFHELRAKQVVKKSNRKGVDDRWLRGKYNCPTCNKVFSTRLKMETHHQHIHLGIAPWTGSHLCEECGKTFTQKVGLKVHRMHKHGDPKQFPCGLCSYEGVTKAKLARHMRSHSEDRVYTCEYCGLALKTADTYKNHMALHTNEGKYQCNVCHKAFHHKQYYEDHHRSHFDIRDYKCVICQTSFKTSKSLRTHIRGVHLNDKRIVCSICGARFMTNYNLRSHMKKHARAEQNHPKHQCKICNKKFHSVPGLDTHQRVAHLGEYQPVQIKIESDASSRSTPITSVMYKRIKSELCEEIDGSQIYTADVEHIIEEAGAEAIAYEAKDSIQDCTEAIETVEAVVEDSGDIEPRQHVSIIYVYPCSDCGTMFTSQDLLMAHMKTHR